MSKASNNPHLSPASSAAPPSATAEATPVGDQTSAAAADVARAHAEDPATQEPTRDKPSEGSRLFFLLQFFGSIAVVGAALVYLMFFHGRGETPPDIDAGGPAALPRAVEQVGPNHIRVDPQTSLGRKLVPGVVQRDEISTALLRVTGMVAASLRPVGPDRSDQWQFNDPAALEAFYNWRRAQVDVQFAQEQTRRMTQLNETRLQSHERIVQRLRRLVDAGTDTVADLQLAEAEYLQAEIEGRQAIHEAESDLRRASQEVAVSARQLEMMGLDVEMLEQASADVDIVVAEVPEDYLARVRIGQQSEARFFGYPRERFPGVVQRVSPTLSLERRALRVLFFVDDPDDRLRPGMFADIGLGTDARYATLVPAEAVIHVGKDDFVFARTPQDAAADPHLWQLVPVEVGDTRQGKLEVLAGVEPGTQIIAQGAILLKPIAAAIVREATRGER